MGKRQRRRLKTEREQALALGGVASASMTASPEPPAFTVQAGLAAAQGAVKPENSNEKKMKE